MTFEFTKYLKDDSSIPDSDHARVPLASRLAGGLGQDRDRKLQEMYEEVGGFGTLLLFGFDYADNPEPWFKSMRLMAEEVMPHFQDKRVNGADLGAAAKA